MDLKETFQLEDDTTLTEEEKKEAEQLQKDEQLRRSDPAAYSALLIQRKQTQATVPMTAAPGGQYLNPGFRVLEGPPTGALPGQGSLLSAYGPRDPVRDPLWQTAIAKSSQIQDRPGVAAQPQMQGPSSSEVSDFERKRAAENLVATTIMLDLNLAPMLPVLGGHTTTLPPQAPRPTPFEHHSRSVTPGLGELSISPLVCPTTPFADHNER